MQPSFEALLLDYALAFFQPLGMAAKSEEATQQLLALVDPRFPRIDSEAVHDLFVALSSLDRVLATLSSSFGGEVGGDSVNAIGALVAAIVDVISSTRTILEVVSVMEDQFPELRESGAGSAFFEYLLSAFMSQYTPIVFGVFDILGLCRIVDPSRDPMDVRVSLESVVSALDDPAAHLLRVYGSRESFDPTVVAVRLFPRIAYLLTRANLGARFDPTSGHLHVLVPAIDVPLSLTVALNTHDPVGFCVDMTLSGNLSLELPTRLGAVRLTARSSGGFSICRTGVTSSTGSVDLGMALRKESAGSTEPTLIGARDSSHFVLGDYSLEIGVCYPISETGDFAYLRASLTRSAFVIRASDGFLASVLPRDGMRIDLSLGLMWSPRKGLSIEGGIGLDVVLPLRLDFCGVVVLDTIRLFVSAVAGEVKFGGGGRVSFRVGPIRSAVNGLGARVSLKLVGPVRNLGFADLSAEFTPPSGAALAIDADFVTGAGVIDFNQQLGRYSGAILLSFSDFSLRAFVLLDTKNLPGVDYSFFVVVSAEFSAIQIGFGFTLSGVGGLCGIQRSVSVEPLQRGVRDGSLAPMLFTRDPVAHASRIVTAISAIFPAAQDSYVFGPIFKLGWGTPTLVTITLGLVIRLPDPITIALIGQVEVRLPKPEAAIVEVNIDILGLLLPDEKFLSIDARLRDSKVAGWTLTGGMAFRLTWGAEPNFLFSVGGFNPHFKPPPSFPQIERLALALGTGTNPRVSLAAYFAVTSNSLQFGARAELYAEALGFSIQGYLEFHALFIFSPFSFRFDFAAGVALKRGSSVIAGITVAGTLSGPRPWRVQGSASISLIFFDLSVSFDETFGQSAEPEQIEAVDAWTKLREALQDLRNWSAPLPVGSHRGVSTAADAETPARLCLDPLSGITLSQKVLPLEQRVSKLGEAPLEGGASVFRIARVRIGAGGSGGTLVDTAPHRDSFAAAQYQPLTDSERLSRPSYEPMIAGVETRADIARSGVVALVDRVWRTEYMRSDHHMEGPASPAAVALMLEMSSATGGGLSAAGLDRFAASPGSTPVVSMAPEMWIACSAEDLRAAGNQAPSSSYSTAAGVLGAMEHAGDSTENQVVPAWEAA